MASDDIAKFSCCCCEKPATGFCSRCRGAFYCGINCMHLCWPSHVHDCYSTLQPLFVFEYINNGGVVQQHQHVAHILTSLGHWYRCDFVRNVLPYRSQQQPGSNWLDSINDYLDYFELAGDATPIDWGVVTKITSDITALVGTTPRVMKEETTAHDTGVYRRYFVRHRGASPYLLWQTGDKQIMPTNMKWIKVVNDILRLITKLKDLPQSWN